MKKTIWIFRGLILATMGFIAYIKFATGEWQTGIWWVYVAALWFIIYLQEDLIRKQREVFYKRLMQVHDRERSIINDIIDSSIEKNKDNLKK